MDFRQNIHFILNHFQEPLFPRTISTKRTNGCQIKVNNIDQLYKELERSNFIDCRINAFPLIEKPIPNFLFIDLDCPHRDISIDNILEITLLNIKRKLSGFPTVMWSGNGYHVYQPILTRISIKEIEDFKIFENQDNRFIRFAKDYLSDNYADRANHPSLGSCLLRIPGSFNSKCIDRGMNPTDSTVKIVTTWNGFRPHIKNLLGTYYAYLVSKEIENFRIKESDIRDRKYSESSEIKWIEKLLKVSLDDYRKFCLWRILLPYLVNIKKLPSSEIYAILEKWLTGCNVRRKLDFKPTIVIRSYMKNVNNFKPISLSKLKYENPHLNNMINSIP